MLYGNFFFFTLYFLSIEMEAYRCPAEYMVKKILNMVKKQIQQWQVVYNLNFPNKVKIFQILHGPKASIHTRTHTAGGAVTACCQ